MKIIVNADDFGASQQINQAITAAFEDGFISNTTIMANMSAYEEAVLMAKNNGFFDNVGIHLNFFSGEPLTEAIKDEPIFYDRELNRLTSKNIYNRKNLFYKFFLPKHTRMALANEAEAQINRYINSGFAQMHLDSHQHAHTIPSVYFSIRNVLKKKGIKTIRLSYNFLTYMTVPDKIYKKIYNAILAKKFNTTEFFTYANKFFSNNPINDDRTCEIMIHLRNQDNTLVCMENIDLDQFSRIVRDHTLISYNQI